MADLSGIQATEAIKIVGSDSSGLELTPVTSTTLGDLSVADVPNQVGVETTISLTTSAVEAKVGGSALTNRKYVTLQALANNAKFGYTTACLYNIFKDQFLIIPAGANCKIYVKSSSGTPGIIVGES